MELLELLIDLRSFHSAQAVAASLNHSAIMRLGRTWGEVDRGRLERWKEREGVFSPLQNWGKFRGMVKSSTVPAIPYIGITLSDLVFVEEGNSDLIEVEGEGEGGGEKYINFQKHRLWADSVGGLKRYQKKGYVFGAEKGEGERGRGRGGRGRGRGGKGRRGGRGGVEKEVEREVEKLVGKGVGVGGLTFSPILSEKEVYARSLEVEPRNSNKRSTWWGN